MTKPIMLINIDSLMTEPLKMAVQTGRAPALKFLMEQGHFIENMVSSFPTMSVTIDSTLLTGTYTDQHRVPALNWFDVENQMMVNYGTGLRETMTVGFSKSVRQMFERLNIDDLSPNVSTIFEDLALHGLDSGVINSFVYRGNKEQRLELPRVLKMMTKLDQTFLFKTPTYFSLGAFSSIRKQSIAPFMIGGNRKLAGRELRALIKHHQIPAFTFCIFQDMDIRVHNLGPFDLKGIQRIDQELDKTLKMFGSYEEAINQCTWIVIGDNGQSATGWNFNDVEINLRKVLKGYQIYNIKKNIKASDELLLSVNQRMAYVYVLDDNIPLIDVAKKLQSDSRIDVIAWKEKGRNHIISGLNNGKLSFSPGKQYQDQYNQSWDIEGELDLLNLKVENQAISYNSFPDALARLHGALHSHKGRFLIVNAKPGCEFLAQKTPIHIGGACHGSLHEQESLIPCIITGTDLQPEHNRLVDMKTYLLNQLIKQEE
ncbi:alkaline phosphatase family protein [Aquisalibacillus elongatus]|uniref:Type I phosphodiesterase/nucleotide pyrophosphatase n=1 Tax=Aquisalibacillus elongatus TaxID=485577 RepID=A0A3N5C189_9BACI|nr:alkaline phosphatase family protein [Aquisalibacillus elongatus]RPF55838.1 type I phosphodiesterase/nucleotide pyrophosphatase [Aquisalibacillus elongatus]